LVLADAVSAGEAVNARRLSACVLVLSSGTAEAASEAGAVGELADRALVAKRLRRLRLRFAGGARLAQKLASLRLFEPWIASNALHLARRVVGEAGCAHAARRLVRKGKKE
jgi:hypothetical protein